MADGAEHNVPPNSTILLLTRAGALRNSLALLLSSISGVQQVLVAHNAASALDQLVQTQPRLVLLDSELFGNEIWMRLEQIRELSPDSRRVVLVDNVDLLAAHSSLYGPALEAVRRRDGSRPAGTERNAPTTFLLKGMLPAELVAAIEQLLLDSGGSEEER